MRGIYAQKDFGIGDQLVFVPDHLVLSYEKALESDVGQIMKKKKLVHGFANLNYPTITTMAVSNMEI